MRSGAGKRRCDQGIRYAKQSGKQRKKMVVQKRSIHQSKSLPLTDRKNKIMRKGKIEPVAAVKGKAGHGK